MLYSVVVEYSDGVCDEAWVQLLEHVSCGCGCRGLACPGLATVDNTTCTCTCDLAARDNATRDCGAHQVFSEHSCACECAETRVSSCVWPLVWSPASCACSLPRLTPELVLGLALALLAAVTLLLCYCNIRYRFRVMNLEVDI